MPNELDPLSPDAPIMQLLSLQHNPLLKEATDEQLRETVTKLRTMASTPMVLTKKLNNDAAPLKERKARPMSAEALKKKNFLDSL